MKEGLVAAARGFAPRDFELRTSKAEKVYLAGTLGVAGRKEDDPIEWVRVLYFGEDAERIAYRLKKGASVYAEGRLQLSKWTTKSGEERQTLEIVAWVLVPMGVEHKRPRSSRNDEDRPPKFRG